METTETTEAVREMMTRRYGFAPSDEAVAMVLAAMSDDES